MLESVYLVQEQLNEYVQQLASKADMPTTHSKMLATQITKQASSSSTPLRRLLSKPMPSTREHYNCIVLEGANN